MTGFAELAAKGLISPDWAHALAAHDVTLSALGEFLREENTAQRGFLPAGDHILRAFQTPLHDVKVLLVGQDPYPTPGHPIGLSFAVAREVRPLPRSLVNIYRELHDDLGIEPAEHGDLSGWTRQGVLLLNRVLTVTPGQPASHRGRGWESITEAAVDALAARGGPCVALLWGRDASSLKSRLGSIPAIESAHPSPLSAHRGFFGSRPFSRINELLTNQGSTPIDWRVDHGAERTPR